MARTSRTSPGKKGPCLTLLVCAAAIAGMLSGAEPGVEMVFELPMAPAGLTVSPRGTFLLSISHEDKPQSRVVEISKTGDSKPFPTDAISQAAKDEPLVLDAVRGMTVDSYGIVWMLDNGHRSELPVKLVAWDYRHNKLHRVIHIVSPAVVPSSVPVDMAVDTDFPFVFIADPANGTDAAMIVVDLTTGVSRRVLMGHPSVVPDAGLTLNIDGSKIESKRLDGSVADPIGGVTPIALDRKGEWLYFGPLRSRRLYRVRTEHLRNVALSADKLAGLVEQYSDKPICGGISLDNKGNVYVSDLAQKAIGIIPAADKQYKILASDPRFLWPDGLCFGPDGRLYFFTNSRRAQTTAAKRAHATPQANYLFKIQTPASGRVGD